MRISEWSSDGCSSDLELFVVRMNVASKSPEIMRCVWRFRRHHMDGGVHMPILLWRARLGVIAQQRHRSWRCPLDIGPRVEALAVRTEHVVHDVRSEERRVGKESIYTCKSRWCP